MLSIGRRISLSRYKSHAQRQPIRFDSEHACTTHMHLFQRY